ncbi:MAG: insulinase family protein [Tannerella sp.]|jgi:zinc protease|nr:insulinase family protein [Tannerella sp.]
MKTLRYTTLGVVFSLFTVLPAAAQMMPQPLPIDTAICYGKLPDGLTYYIRHNELPKGRADFYLVQNVGSILEEENQRGLAHFLEHMAFDGSKHFPNTNIREFTERVGMRFGQNLNASTGVDETIYFLKDAPITKPGVLDSCLLVLHDWSGCLTLPDSMIKKERGVITEEWRYRQSPELRMLSQQLPQMYPGSRYAERLPIGLMSVVNGFKPEELRAYYKKWYRPDLQGIVIVGDIDAKKVEQQLKDLYADIPAPVNPAKRIYYPVADNDSIIVSIAKDKEFPYNEIDLMYKYDKLPRQLRGTIIGLMTDYLSQVTSEMLNERFQDMLQKANPPFIQAGTHAGDYLIAKTKGAWDTYAVAANGKVDEALKAITTEMHRAKKYGFTASEYERARANVLKAYESAYKERNHQNNSYYVNEYVSHFTDGGYIPGIETEYTLINQIAPKLTLKTVNQYFDKLVNLDSDVVMMFNYPDKPGVQAPDKAELLRVYNAAMQAPVEAYKDQTFNGPLIPNLPAKGSIVKTEKDPLFGATVLTLSNGAKVVLKHTDFKKDEILMTATSPGGSTLYGNKDEANLKVFDDVTSLGGLGQFSATDLTKALAGKQVSVSTSLGRDNEGLNGSSTPSDLKTMFELIYLTFTAPRVDNDAYASYMSRLKAELRNLSLNPMTAFTDTLARAMNGNNPRENRITEAELNQVSYPRIMEIYKQRFADASDFVFTFVGNINQDSIRPLIEQYLASLPALHRKEAGNLKNVVYPRKGDYTNDFTRNMETPKSTVIHIYTGTVKYDLDDLLASTIMSRVLSLVYTQKVREDQSGAYGVQVGANIWHFPKGSALLQIMYDTAPTKLAKMDSIVKAEIREFPVKGPSQTDFNKTIDNLKKSHAEQLQRNSYWLNVLDTYYSEGFDLNTHYLETLDKMTPKKVQDYAKKLLGQGNAIEVVMSSEKKALY